MGYAYILRSIPTGRFYIGSTIDVSVRLFRHNAGHHLSTKAYRPWKLIYTSSFETLVEARRRERKIKTWKNPQYMCDTLKIDLKL
jgi:putative endonuclease